MVSSASTSNYRSTGGANTSSNSYRGANSRNDRDDSNANTSRHRSPMGIQKRPMRTGYISRARGNISSYRGGMRSTMLRGGVRIIRNNRNEANDLRIMRRKLLYAQQKDRARVLKIQRLTR
ncbi:PREDICTED: uncharacterized protein LOC108356771 [Rhagoletis zephyria]|uniref:uncharacterized protein LOC108356771 n=1 Tax=Rhagoletis zephyria TaxID=28612 RepID=UPI0008112FB8|nr:PREDICTED: uncharacterized protein LOC108356771 [Rhagoletis zephyria]XP_017463363.1 PREDICTED: uncharacterized protein LOC108356771 [Rhagoletis zephyria]